MTPYQRIATISTCVIEGCEEPLLARGWCGKHYQRWYRESRLPPKVYEPLPLKTKTYKRIAILQRLAYDRDAMEQSLPCSTFKSCVGLRDPRGLECPGCPLKASNA